MTQSTETYAEAYAKLASIADKLKAGNAGTIDTLADDVRAARHAFAICRHRLDAIRREIDAELASEPAAPG